MSRGGRRGGGGRKTGPSTEDWDSGEEDKKKWLPERTYPLAQRVLPARLSDSERARFYHYRKFREAIHDGPLYTVLEPNLLADANGKINKRAGFNPFEGMPTYSEMKYKKAKRTVPDLSRRPYVLKYFPQELWPTIDPMRKAPEWKTMVLQNQDGAQLLSSSGSDGLAGPSSSAAIGKRVYESGLEDDEEEDVITANRKKRRKVQKDDPILPGQKKGLEAEDEYGPDPDPADADDDGEEAEAVDTDFSESEDGGGDDYDAEQYFDTGEQDDYDDVGDNDDGVY